MTTAPVRPDGRGWPAAAAMLVLGLPFLRVYPTVLTFYVFDVLDIEPAVVGLLALGTFAVPLAATRLARLPGRRTATAGIVALAGLRVAEQLTMFPPADAFLSGLGVAVLGVMMVVLAARLPAAGVAVGVVAGVVLDGALRSLLYTVDLSWQAGVLPAALTTALGIGAIAAVRAWPDGPTGGWGSLSFAGSVAVGLWLVLQLVVFQNAGFASSVTGWTLSASQVLLGAAGGAALATVVWRVGRAGSRRAAGAAGVALAGSAVGVAAADGWPAGVALVAGSIAGAVLLADLMAPRLSGARPMRGARAAAGGYVLLMVALFAHYGSYNYPLGFRSAAVPPAVAMLLTGWAVVGTPAGGRRGGVAHRPLLAAAVVLALLGPVVVWTSPGPTPSDGSGVPLRIVNYNLHQGFSIDGRMELEALAAVIEQARPDVLALQEVSRGWVTTGAVDMLGWLSRRLGMPYVVWGPTADRQWGNAVLSRHRVVGSRNVSLPPDSLTLRRGYLDVTIGAGGTEWRVLVTHLHHVGRDDSVRTEQARRLVAGWNGTERTVVAGDLNAEPGEPAMAVLFGAGLVDVMEGRGARETHPSNRPSRQIDYLLVSPDVVVTRAWIPRSTASDHLPVAADVSPAP